MKIIIYGINFKPEIVGIGKYSGELADYLDARGHNIKVITAPKYYPEWQVQNNIFFKEKESNYTIYRCPLYVPKSPTGFKRILHLMSFAISSFPLLIMQLRWAPDCIIFIAPTIFCSANIIIFKFLSFKKIFSIIHIKDFELDAAFNLGILKGKLFKYLFLKIEIFILKSFQMVGTISNGMIDKLKNKSLKSNKIFYFPDWVDINLIKQKKITDKYNNIYRKKLKIDPKTIVIQYSGTMNIKQGFDFLLPIIKHFKEKKNVLWLFGGTGPLKNNFINSTKDIPNIMFLPFQESEYMNQWLNTGDIHIIPQSEKVEDLLFPSKLLSILASGNPIVSNANKKSELGKLIELAGKRVDPNDKKGFIDSLNLFINDENLRIKFGQKAREIAEHRFSKEKVLQEFETLLINKNRSFYS